MPADRYINQYGPGYGTQSAPAEPTQTEVDTLKWRAFHLRKWVTDLKSQPPRTSMVTHNPIQEFIEKTEREIEDIERQITFIILQREHNA